MVQRTPVGADTHRLLIAQRHLDDGGELAVFLSAETDVAWIDPVFGQGLRASRLRLQQLMTVVMEVANDRHVDAHHIQPLANTRHGGSGRWRVYRNAYQFGAGAGQFGDLLGGACSILGIGIGHRLHHDRRALTYQYFADLYADAGPA